MALQPNQVAAITHRRKKAQAEKDLDIERNRLSLALGSGDPRAVADWQDSLVAARLGPDSRIYCIGCHPHGSIKFSADPDTKCPRCERKVGAGR